MYHYKKATLEDKIRQVLIRRSKDAFMNGAEIALADGAPMTECIADTVCRSYPVPDALKEIMKLIEEDRANADNSSNS